MISNEKGGKFQAWLKIARLQSYPLTWIAYTMGATVRSTPAGKFSLTLYLLGYLYFLARGAL